MNFSTKGGCIDLLENNELASNVCYIPGLEGKDNIGVRSTTETVLSAPQAQPHSQLFSDFAVNENVLILGSELTG